MTMLLPLAALAVAGRREPSPVVGAAAASESVPHG